MSNRVSTPFPIYNDTDGTPLDAGFVFIGEKGKNPTVSPIAIFYDAALTMPAENPLRTRNGYVVRNGAPREVFTADPIVSILVQNKQKIAVWSSASINLNPGITPEAVVDPVTGDSQADINATILKKGENLDDLPNKDEARTNLGVYSKEEVDEKFTDKVKDATEEVKGIIRVATSAEAKAGESDAVAITPKKLPDALTKAMSATTGEAPLFPARAYGLFDGAATKVAGGNFESVTRISEGLFEVTLTKAMGDIKYIVITTGGVSGANEAISVNEDKEFTRTTTKFRLVCTYGGDNTKGRLDPDQINFMVLG